jgi:hypothetical protein
MNEMEFREQLDVFTGSVRAEALRLFASGIDPGRVLKLAIDIATARMLTAAENEARARRILGVAPAPGGRPA